MTITITITPATDDPACAVFEITDDANGMKDTVHRDQVSEIIAEREARYISAGHKVEIDGWPTTDDDGCPKGDPECLAANGDNHDTCTTATERERAETHSLLCSIHDGGKCTCDGDLDWAPDADEVAAFAYPSPGDKVTTADGAAASVYALDHERGDDFAPEVILDLGETTRRTEAAFLIRTGPSSWRERLPRAGTVGGAAPAQVLEVGDIFHGAPLPSEPLPMEWRADLSDHAGGHALVIVADADAGRDEAWVLDVLFSDRAQGEALRPIILEAAQRIMMQPVEAYEAGDAYLDRFPADHRQSADRAYSDGMHDGAGNVTLADLLDEREIATILASLRAAQAVQQAEALEPEFMDIATDGGTLEPLDDGEVDDLCERINCDTPRAALPPPSTVYMVEGLHWSTPGRPVHVFATRTRADRKAADLVNSMLEELELEACTDWEEGLARVKAEQMEDSDVDVWITELPLTE